MDKVNQIKSKVLHEIELMKTRLFEISDTIYYNPEIGYQEHKASELLVSEFEKHGFRVQRCIAGLPTSFKAVCEGVSETPKIALLAEYDALLGMGHACGHNLIATISTGAALALSKVMPELKGTLLVFGTPAEEGCVDNAGGKVVMIDEIKKVDAAMMFHPSDRTSVVSRSIAREAIKFEFSGKAAHAASAPWKGINALEAVMLTFAGINALRQHVKPDVKIHGIITDGGEVPNIVPWHAVAKVYVRASTAEASRKALEKVKNCARGAALMTGANVRMSKYVNTYKNMITNMTIAEILRKNLHELGVEVKEHEERSVGSTDMGTVSYVVPAVHAYIKIGSEGMPDHSTEFLNAAISEEGHNAIIIAAKSLAMTAIDLFESPELMRKAKQELDAATGVTGQ